MLSSRVSFQDRIPGEKRIFPQGTLTQQVLIHVNDQIYFFIADFKNKIQYQMQIGKIVPQL